MYQHLLYELSDGLARITLHRPQVYNALSPELIQEITAAVQAAEADESVRVVLLTGAGDKAFCSGADLKAGMGEATGMGDALRTRYNPMILALRNLPKPVVCRLNGLAAGAGCSLALACDVVIATEEAYLSQIFVNIGLMPDAGSTFFLPRLVGMARAFELASTGRRVYAPEAVELGLIQRAVPAAQLDEAVNEVLDYYRSAPTRAIGTMKQVLNQSLYSDLPAMLELEARYQDELSQTQDAAEGIGAFLQKRQAVYQGR
ncbi:enoyl-CoA hydratase/isomerase family protein [Telluribacter sp.]|jgi:2-(1,2-epoxy-1,2-dihydrophenyl)acetyl-CoA isomerase|uniref:enoyl-CoA hydratase/isomerase family protein n=1 Tax=Telluribacter sp. TaxID=1978767 RepID=UPI002E0EB49E|nr:enoyl-CoA hydratase-related protein [Telluribacter sp.]